MNAADLARRIHDNLNWARIVGAGPSRDGASAGLELWPRLQAIWTEPDDLFLGRLYFLLLGRPPDPESRAARRAALKAGQSRADVVRAVARGDEARALRLDLSWLPRLEELPPDPVWGRVTALWTELDVVFVEGLYSLFLGRNADPEGLARYCALLAGGRPRAAVVRALVRSGEARVRGVDDSWLSRLRTLPPPPGAPRRRFLIGALSDVLRRLASLRPRNLWLRVRARWGRSAPRSGRG